MAKLKVLVVAEGPSEIGELDSLAWAPGKRRKRRVEGYMPPMIRKLLGRDADDVDVRAQSIRLIGRIPDELKLDGHGRRAAGAVALAQTEACDLLVFVKDVDREPATRNPRASARRSSKRCTPRSIPRSGASPTRRMS